MRAIFAVILALVVVFAVGYIVYTPPNDFTLAFRPAALTMLRGGNIYEAGAVFNPPWVIAASIPVALLPERPGFAAFFTISFFCFAFVAYRLGAKPLTMGLFFIAPPVFTTLNDGNLEALVLLALVVPAPIAPFFALIKPQVGAMLIPFLVVIAWQRGGWRRVTLVLLPITLALALSCIPYGPWLLYSGNVSNPWNLSNFPRLIPIGLLLMVYAIRQKQAPAALASSMFLSPYYTLNAWVAPLTMFMKRPVYLAAAVAGLWLLIMF